MLTRTSRQLLATSLKGNAKEFVVDYRNAFAKAPWSTLANSVIVALIPVIAMVAIISPMMGAAEYYAAHPSSDSPTSSVNQGGSI